MPDPRGLFFVINERQHRPRPYPDPGRDLPYASVDALPLATEPQRERAMAVGRQVRRLRMLIRPNDLWLRRSSRSGEGSARV